MTADTALHHEPPGQRPLEGVRVLEFAHVASGPFAAMLLADLGADVVKVEAPEGDQMRGWPPLAHDESGASFSHNFASLNRNKRSVVANLKDPDQLARVRRLCDEADVIVQNYRPGVLDRLGLGYDALSEEHRGLVYCSISGYGLSSPYVNHGAYDVVIQAMSGLMSVTGTPRGELVKCGVPVADFIAGLYAAYTIAAVLPNVRSTGSSVHLDCPMLDCLIATSALQTSEYWGTGVDPRPMGSAHPRNAPYQAFHARDRDFVIAAGNDRLWGAVCEAVALPELARDPRFIDQERRVENQFELSTILQQQFSTAPAAHWLDEFARRQVPCGSINSFGEILSDPHVRQTGLVQAMEIPIAGVVPSVVYPVRISGPGARIDRRPPILGADTQEVFEEWGVG